MSGGGKLAGAGAVRAQQVPDEVWARGLPRRAEAGTDPGARSHSEGVEQVTYSCGTVKRERGEKCERDSKILSLLMARDEICTFGVRSGTAEENVFLHCS